MRKTLYLLIFLLMSSEIFAVETIIFIRHAEKPDGGIGQLSCKGLQRSLKLPNLLGSRFGEPDILIAPNPVAQKKDHGVYYNYIRPLATIEPTAIKYKKNVDLGCGFDQIDCVTKSIDSQKNSNKLIFVAWEHHLIKNIIEKIASIHNATVAVPEWKNDDFDSIYILKIENNSVTLEVQKQNLLELSEKCDF